MDELDNLDIYDDLDEFQEQEQKKSKELQDLENKYQDALKANDSLQLENKQLQKKIKTIEINFQNLLDTAKSEIRRKNQLIDQLRKEKDDVCFRRNQNKNPFKNAFKKSEDVAVTDIVAEPEACKTVHKNHHQGNKVEVESFVTLDQDDQKKAKIVDTNTYVERRLQHERYKIDPLDERGKTNEKETKEREFNFEHKRERGQYNGRSRQQDKEEASSRNNQEKRDTETDDRLELRKLLDRKRERVHYGSREEKRRRSREEDELYLERTQKSRYEQNNQRDNIQKRRYDSSGDRDRLKRRSRSSDRHFIQEKRSETVEIHSREFSNKRRISDLKEERCQKGEKDSITNYETHMKSKRIKSDEKYKDEKNNGHLDDQSKDIEYNVCLNKQTDKLSENTEDCALESDPYKLGIVGIDSKKEEIKEEIQMPSLEETNKIAEEIVEYIAEEHCNKIEEIVPSRSQEDDAPNENPNISDSEKDHTSFDDYLELFAETDISDTETPNNTPMKKQPVVLLSQLCEPIESDEEIDEIVNETSKDIVDKVDRNIKQKVKSETSRKDDVRISHKKNSRKAEKRTCRKSREECEFKNIAKEKETEKDSSVQISEAKQLMKPDMEPVVEMNFNEEVEIIKLVENSVSTEIENFKIIENALVQSLTIQDKIIAEETKETETHKPETYLPITISSPKKCTENNKKEQEVQKNSPIADEFSEVKDSTEILNNVEKELKEQIDSDDCKINEYEPRNLDTAETYNIEHIEVKEDRTQETDEMKSKSEMERKKIMESLINDKRRINKTLEMNTGTQVNVTEKRMEDILRVKSNRMWCGFKIPKRAATSQTQKEVVPNVNLAENDEVGQSIDEFIKNQIKEECKPKRKSITLDMYKKSYGYDGNVLKNNPQSELHEHEVDKKTVETDQHIIANTTCGAIEAVEEENKTMNVVIDSDEAKNTMDSTICTLVEEIFDKSAGDQSLCNPIEKQITPQCSPCGNGNDNEVEMRMRSIFQSPQTTNSNDRPTIISNIIVSNANNDMTIEETAKNINSSSIIETSTLTPDVSTTIVNSSNETKELVMGTSKYVFEKISDNTVHLYITRNRSRKRKKVTPEIPTSVSISTSET